MGVVKRQSFKASGVNYAGTILGIITTFFLFPRIFTPDEFGVTRLLVAMLTVLIQFPLFAMPSIIVKFFPEFESNKEEQGLLLYFANFSVLIGLIIFGVVFFVFKDMVLHYFSAEKSALFTSYYWLVLPLVIFTAIYANFEAYCMTKLRITVPAIIKEVVIRLLTIAAILLYYFQLITFNVFIYLFVSIYGAALIIIILYAARMKFPFHWNLKIIHHTVFREIQRYGFYIYISVVSLVIIGGIDSIMVGSMVGLAGLSIYAIGSTIAVMLQIPFRSISQITAPLFAEAWKNNDLEKIRKMNKDSGLNIMIIGCFLFILIWANIDNIIALLPAKYQTHELTYVVLWIALGKLFDMTTGLNDQIIFNSPQYRFALVMVAILAISTVLLNYFFISLYGIVGAAIATCCTLFLFNSSKFLFLWIKFRMQPYSLNGILVLLIAAVVLFLIHFLPVVGNWFADGIVRSVIICLLFLTPVIFLKLSPDLNEFLNKIKTGKISN